MGSTYADPSPMLCQEATKSLYSSRVSLGVLMAWCVVAYPWEGVLVLVSPAGGGSTGTVAPQGKLQKTLCFRVSLLRIREVGRLSPWLTHRQGKPVGRSVEGETVLPGTHVHQADSTIHPGAHTCCVLGWWNL